VAKKSKKKEYHFSFQTVLRLLIFSGIVYLLITLISAKKLDHSSRYDPTVLGEETSSASAQLFIKNTLDSTFKMLPPKSQETIKNFHQNPLYLTVQKNLDFLKKESENFPQKQVKEIKKSIINEIYKNMMDNIDSDN